MRGRRQDRQSELATTDYKLRVEDEGILEREKRELTTQDTGKEAQPVIPRPADNPALAELKKVKASGKRGKKKRGKEG